MKTRKVTKRQVEAEPYLIWNSYVNLLAMEDYRDLSPEQRPAHLVFWYEHEVQNGGHLQYFENHGTRHLDETIEALGQLGATEQQQVLREAGALWLAREREPILTAEEYCATALEGEFSGFDDRVYRCSPSLPECLEAHLKRHESWFVTVI